jgi:2-furoate---CoA ligase
MDLATAFSWTAQRYPRRRAVGGPAPMTYRQWDARTNRLARALARLGVRPADRVAFCLAGGEPLAGLHIAAQKLGAASVPLSTRFGQDELTYCLADADARLLVTDLPTTEGIQPDEVDRIADTEPDGPIGYRPRQDDLGVLLYTSGTTGRPKGVPRTHAAEHAATVAHLIQTQHRPGEVTLGVMPLFHTMGLRSLLATILAGGTWVPQARFDAEESLELVAAERITALYLVPTAYWALLRADGLDRLRSVRRLAYAGAAMTPTLADELITVVRPDVFVNHFGSTEIYTFTVCPDVAAKPGCAGRAGVFTSVRLVDPGPGATPDDLVDDGKQGQVVVSMAGPEAFGGYWHRPDADRRAIRDGWYFTGDLAVADDDGDLWVAGRTDDMINSGGENIYPDEIEAALARCPAISDVVVAGLPDDRWGQVVTAFVVPASGISADDSVQRVRRYVAEESGLPSLKQPKRVLAIAEVPKSAVGKVLRRKLIEGTP